MWTKSVSLTPVPFDLDDPIASGTSSKIWWESSTRTVMSHSDMNDGADGIF